MKVNQEMVKDGFVVLANVNFDFKNFTMVSQKGLDKFLQTSKLTWRQTEFIEFMDSLMNTDSSELRYRIVVTDFNVGFFMTKCRAISVFPASLTAKSYAPYAEGEVRDAVCRFMKYCEHEQRSVLYSYSMEENLSLEYQRISAAQLRSVNQEPTAPVCYVPELREKTLALKQRYVKGHPVLGPVYDWIVERTFAPLVPVTPNSQQHYSRYGFVYNSEHCELILTYPEKFPAEIVREMKTTTHGGEFLSKQVVVNPFLIFPKGTGKKTYIKYYRLVSKLVNAWEEWEKEANKRPCFFWRIEFHNDMTIGMVHDDRKGDYHTVSPNWSIEDMTMSVLKMISQRKSNSKDNAVILEPSDYKFQLRVMHNAALDGFPSRRSNYKPLKLRSMDEAINAMYPDQPAAQIVIR